MNPESNHLPVLYYPERHSCQPIRPYFWPPFDYRAMRNVIPFLLLPALALAQPAPKNLKCEHEAHPLGLDEPKPRLSWQGSATNRGARQTAYQILVATDEQKLTANVGDAWDSGKITSDQSVFVEYAGKPLRSRQRYFWKVKTWDERGKPSAWSAPEWWEMALLDRNEWKGEWIGMAGAVGKPPRSVQARKAFTLTQKPTRARIYATGLGTYTLNLNGKKVGTDFLAPGWTDYLKKVFYQTYDITDQVSVGENTLDAWLGSAWWSSGLGWSGGFAYADGPLRLLAQVVLDYPDGTSHIIATDGSWKVRFSPVTYDHLYHGEHYDARLEAKPGFDANDGWVNATLLSTASNPTTLFGNDPAANAANEAATFNQGAVKIVAQQGPSIRLTETLTPQVSEPKPGHFVFDFGQNFAGIVRLKLTKTQYGQRVRLRYAELLHDDGTVAQENLRSALATDEYIANGTRGGEAWAPRFVYHGFRYVEVTGLSEKPDSQTLTGLVLHTDTPPTGQLTTSNELLNRVYQNCRWTLRSNSMSVPTDCPQRDERLGWMGDAQIFAPTGAYLMDIDGFFGKWVADIADSQHANGSVFDVNPKMVVPGPAKPAWGDAVTVVPWTLYQFYGDKRLLERSYNAMKRWVEYMNTDSTTRNHGLYFYTNGHGWYGFGDWVPVKPSPSKPIGGAYQVYSNQLLANAAAVLGKTDDAATYAAAAKRYADRYNALYFSEKELNYEGKTQAANLIPLSLGVVPDAVKAQIAKNVADDVKTHGNHLTTGFIASQMLLPRLSDYGYHELAYQVATQKTYPSWGYMAENGATTMWELWNSDKEKPEGMNSRNHFSYGSVVEWYFGYLAGLRPDPAGPGFKKFIVAPQPAGDLNFVKATYQTPYGEAVSNWEKTDAGLTLDVTIPANSSARVVLPLAAGQTAKLDGKAVKGKEVALGAGRYRFEIR